MAPTKTPTAPRAATVGTREELTEKRRKAAPLEVVEVDEVVLVLLVAGEEVEVEGTKAFAAD